MIDKTAIIDKTAMIPDSCEIGPMVTIGKGVKLGENVKIMANAYLEYCEIGDNTLISPFASLGTMPQDLGYKNEPTKAVIGKDCIIKEYVTVNRSAKEGEDTIVGNKCLLMTSAHVAHNCVLEDEVILANLVTLGGHVRVGYGAFVGGMSVFHQNISIGEMCIVSGFSASRQDILPYVKADGRPACNCGINVIGLKRRGLTLEERTNIKRAIKILTSGEYTATKAISVIEETMDTDNKYIKKIVDFVKNSKRGVVLSGRTKKEEGV